MKKRTVLIPTYMQHFQCTGSVCEDTCCSGWNVSIDKSTYKEYNKIKNAELLPMFDSHIKRNRQNPTDSRYAYIQLTENGACPFLTSDRLCKIQLQVGVEYLSNTCTNYPRIQNLVNNFLERSATLSCPEVARLALLDPKGIVFTEVEEPSVKTDVVSILDSRNSNSLEQYFWELRIFTIQTIQNRNYSLADRLVILGLFYQQLQNLINEEKISEIPIQIATFTAMIQDGSLSANLPLQPDHIMIQIKFLKALSDERFMRGVNNKRFLECANEFLKGIDCAPEHSDEHIALCYRDAADNYYSPFMREHEYILENYLVNYIFKNTFPLSKEQGVFDEYVLLVLHHALIKMYLIGMARYHQENFNVDLVVKLIQSFSRAIEHSNFLKDIYRSLEANGYNTLMYMAILVRN